MHSYGIQNPFHVVWRFYFLPSSIIHPAYQVKQLSLYVYLNAKTSPICEKLMFCSPELNSHLQVRLVIMSTSILYSLENIWFREKKLSHPDLTWVSHPLADLTRSLGLEFFQVCVTGASMSFTLLSSFYGPCDDSKNGKKMIHGPCFACCWRWGGTHWATLRPLQARACGLQEEGGFSLIWSHLEWL